MGVERGSFIEEARRCWNGNVVLVFLVCSLRSVMPVLSDLQARSTKIKTTLLRKFLFFLAVSSSTQKVSLSGDSAATIVVNYLHMDYNLTLPSSTIQRWQRRLFFLLLLLLPPFLLLFFFCVRDKGVWVNQSRSDGGASGQTRIYHVGTCGHRCCSGLVIAYLLSCFNLVPTMHGAKHT